MAKIRWGILSTGRIAKEFTEALASVPESEVVAVGSRNQASAEEFGNQYNIPHRYASYEALVADPEVDVVYIGTPHNLHYENMKLALGANKHVLCEKAFTINATQAAEVIALARAKKRFLMEAMWTRFIPAIVQVRQWIADGEIGKVRYVSANFCFQSAYNPEGRLYNPNLAGGALLDVGIYVISFASMVLGSKPQHIYSHRAAAPTGVDQQNSLLLGYPDGAAALLTSAVSVAQPEEARIVGDKGWITVPHRFHDAEKASLFINGQEEKTVRFPLRSNGLEYEAEEVQACIQAGKLESSIMPLDETLAILQIMDTVRAQWGFRYPEEM